MEGGVGKGGCMQTAPSQVGGWVAVWLSFPASAAET
jgi:hypothetical protein